MLEIKSKYEYEGKDFEAGVAKVYSETRIKLAKIYSLTDFGLFELTEVSTRTSSDDLRHIKETSGNKKKISRIGYENSKSGSGKIVVDNSCNTLISNEMTSTSLGLKISFWGMNLIQMEWKMEVESFLISK